MERKPYETSEVIHTLLGDHPYEEQLTVVAAVYESMEVRLERLTRDSYEQREQLVALFGELNAHKRAATTRERWLGMCLLFACVLAVVGWAV